MTYRQSGAIQASTYNAYAAILNSIYADTNSGSTVESSADYGYGQATVIPTLSIGANITAANWTTMFNIIHLCGTHQGVSVTPIPSSVSAGNLITAYNNYLSTQTLTDVISRLSANRLMIDVGQSSTIAGPSSPSSPSWTTGLAYSFQVDFGTWNNARYFFNTGGSITMAGGVNTPVTTEDIFWQGMLAGMNVLKFSWHDTLPSAGAGSTIGFYDLTTSDIQVYERSPVSGGVYYSNNFISISGRLVNPAGTDGKVVLTVNLIDNDTSPNAKTVGNYYFNIGVIQSSGVVAYPGPSVVVSAGTFSTIANTPYTGVPLTVTSSVPTGTQNVLGAGVATIPLITITPAGGTAPYSYLWQKDPLIPADANLTFSASTSASSTVSYNLTSGQIYSTTVKVTVTDSAARSTYILIPVSFNSNVPN